MKEIEEWREGKTWLEKGAEVGVGRVPLRRSSGSLPHQNQGTKYLVTKHLIRLCPLPLLRPWHTP